jgi:hypothetical protein
VSWRKSEDSSTLRRDDGSGLASLRADLALSAGAMRSAPLLVVFTVIVFGVTNYIGLAGDASHGATQGWLYGAWCAVLLVTAGFLGTQRAWFRDAFRGEKLRADEAASLTIGYMRRFVELGVLVVIPLVPVAVVATSIDRNSRPGPFFVAAYAILLDVTLTFAVPALALTTSSVWQALRIGRHMIAATWPTCAGYVLLPGVTFAALVFVLPKSSTVKVIDLIGAVLFPVIALWFKGAILAFYLRHTPTTSTA